MEAVDQKKEVVGMTEERFGSCTMWQPRPH
jgi:hypothetical protein